MAGLMNSIRYDLIDEIDRKLKKTNLSSGDREKLESEKAKLQEMNSYSDAIERAVRSYNHNN